MDINEAFPSRYLKASDINGEMKVTIEGDRMATLQDGTTKPELRFVGVEKGLILNKTNSLATQASYGSETDNWRGKRLTLYVANVEFRGAITPAIRVRVPEQEPAAAAAPGGDDIPF